MKSIKRGAVRRPSARCIVLAVLACCLAATGCSTSKAKRARTNAEVRRLTEFWEPHKLYLHASLHSRLHVEVDAVEGCSPSEETLGKLREFLRKHCDKPGGIEIVRSDVIPRHDAVGVLPSALARKFLNGPAGRKGEEIPAYLYVLFYSDVLSDRPSVRETGHQGARAAARSRLRNRNPHVDMLPYPAMIYMNVEWHPKSLHDGALLHEAGHVLGLAFRPSEASAGHCTNDGCLMNPSVHLVRYLLGLERPLREKLCDRCLAQFAAGRENPAKGNVRFVGPVLVRSAPGYDVLSLPNRTHVIVGNCSENDCREFAAAVRAERPNHSESEAVRHGGVTGSREMMQDNAKLREVIRQIEADPDPLVQHTAGKMWPLYAAQCNASGQYAEAVNACGRASRSDPEEPQSYNLLAWIKATCPDASIRHGKEAVEAATKACALTHWQEWNFIDTLAAAWAEAGDFEKAVGFQKRALMTGEPPEAAQKEMRERLVSYRQSCAFRQK